MKLTKLSILTLTILLITSCTTSKFIKFNDLEDEKYPSEKLKIFLKENKNPKVVVRINENKTKVITGNYSENNSAYFGYSNGKSKTTGQSNFVEKEISYDYLYNAIEKELLKQNFIVRDRQLFSQVISNNENTLDYAKLKEKTDTDLIIEISKIDETIKYSTNKYYTGKGKEGILGFEYTKYGAEVEFKVIIVRDNEFAGTYKFNYSPCNNESPCQIDKDFKTRWKKIAKGKIGYEIVEKNKFEQFIRNATRQLVESMRN